MRHPAQWCRYARCMVVERALETSTSLALSWSGGKDSALALQAARGQGMEPDVLITTITDGYERISMHGVRRELLALQATSLGIPVVEEVIPPGCMNEVYEARMGSVRVGAPSGVDAVASATSSSRTFDGRSRLQVGGANGSAASSRVRARGERGGTHVSRADGRPQADDDPPDRLRRVTTAVESGAQGIRWDLTPLAPSEEAMKERLEAAVADAAAFVERWSAKSLETIEPTSLRALLRELADIRAARSEARQWAFMLTKTDSENPAVLDIRAWVDIRSPRLDDAIRHFELAWMALPDDRARSLAEDEAVARDRHYLLGVRRFRPFMLSPAEERVLSARDASAGTAWQTLRDRTLGSLSARFDDGSGEREWPLSELESARRAHPDRDVRRRAQETTTALFEPALPVIAHCYDSLVADRLAVDDLRGHDDPMDQRTSRTRSTPAWSRRCSPRPRRTSRSHIGGSAGRRRCSASSGWTPSTCRPRPSKSGCCPGTRPAGWSWTCSRP